jgi:hypothetical protein
MIAFDILEQIKDAIGLVRFDGIGFVVEFFVHFRVITEDLQGDFHSLLSSLETLRVLPSTSTLAPDASAGE